MNLLPVLSQGAGGGELILMLVYAVVIFGAFYFFGIRPQKKQQKEHEALVSQLEPGDSVLTSGGFYGVILDVMDQIVIVEFGNNKNCRIPMKREAILEVEKANAEKKN